MPKMTDSDLRDLVAKRRDASWKYSTGIPARERRDALRYFRGDNLDDYGDSGDGLSTVVSRDFMEAVESSMPSLLKPFVSGDEVVRFEPRGPEDEEAAKQATDYINYLFFNHNDGFRVIYDSLKNGLMYKYGPAKVVVEEVTETEFETYQSLSVEDVSALDADKEQTIVGDEVTQEQDGTFTVQVQRTVKRKLFRVINIPTDRFLAEPRIADLNDGTFFAHHEEKTVGDLIEMGLPRKKCMELSAGSPVDYQDEDQRFEGEASENLDQDDLARKVWVDDCYIRTDYNGDGTLRWRRVLMGGGNNTILLNEEADDHPFVGWTPIPEPGKLVGQGMFDLTKDIQRSKTAIKREAQNALYLANRPMREVVEGQVNIDDLLSPSVGGVVRVKQANAVREIPGGGDGVIAQSLSMLEALDSEREARTGVTRYNQGMDANSLNKTATGVSIITNASQQRQELIARNYAEDFLKDTFRKMLKLVSQQVDKPEVLRLRGEWVEMDPRDWKTGYDMSISVGLGTGNKDQMVAHLQALAGVQAQIAQAQDGLNGPIVYWENVYETAKKYPELMGFKGSEKFFSDPAKPKEQEGPEQPDEGQQQQQVAQQQAEAEQQKQAAELKQKHDTAVETAHIDADSKVTVARIDAVKELVLAGLSVAEAEAVTEMAAAGDMPESVNEPQIEGDEFAPEPMPPMPEAQPDMMPEPPMAMPERLPPEEPTL